MNSKLIYITLIALTLFGCQKSQDSQIADKSVADIVASLPKTETKVELTDGDNSVAVEWEKNDVFSLYNATGELVCHYYSTSIDNDGTAHFSAINIEKELVDGEQYTAIFPAIIGIKNIDEHRNKISSMNKNQYQSGNSNNSHISETLQMESQFRYKSSETLTHINFEHKVATMRISFETADNAIPKKVIFRDGGKSYTLNFNNATNADIYCANFVIDPNSLGSNRQLEFEIFDTNKTSLFTTTSNKVYNRGVQYRSDIAYHQSLIYIDSKDDLLSFSKAVNDGNSNINAIVTANISLTGVEWIPIGDNNNNYSGTFDGGNCTISGLTIDPENSSDYSYQGLFGYVSGANISNIKLSNTLIHSSAYTGALVGYATNKSTIKNCSTNYTTIVCGRDFVGGLIGYITNSTISGCSTMLGSVEGNGEVAGLVGRASSTSFVDCSNNNTAIGKDNSVGGIAGHTISCSFDGCSNSGVVTGKKESVGGVIGSATSLTKLNNCYNEGKVNGSWDRVAGVIASTYNTKCSITKCYNHGDITGGMSNVAGVIGYIHSSVSNAMISDCYNTGGVINGAKDNVGGVVGYCGDATINKCFNTGQVLGRMNMTAGVVANFKASKLIIECYNSGKISGGVTVGGITGECSGSIQACYNTGAISGTARTGGIVGDISMSAKYIMGCYNTNRVSSTGSYCGGIVGLNVGKIPASKSYYASGYSYSTPDGTSMSTTSMKSTTFVTTLNNSGGGNCWTSINNQWNNGYPTLKEISYPAN